MLSKKLALFLPVLLVGCAISDTQMRQRYAEHYYQPPEYVAHWQKKSATMSVNELAVEGAAMQKKRLAGKSRMKIDDSVYIVDVHPLENKVVFEYALTQEWLALSPAAQQKRQKMMQKDLIYRTCSLETVKLAQFKGLEEVHNYYSHYPDTLAFTLHTSRQICNENGFPR
ncbi:hypothetical protein [Vagococcus sp. WN89Y]|uniref:hypothetical protein n=1 Tax=Vagococcus sp. WN89Y TaxID=3457258 RepID=UPI003FCE5F24